MVVYLCLIYSWLAKTVPAQISSLASPTASLAIPASKAPKFTVTVAKSPAVTQAPAGPPPSAPLPELPKEPSTPTTPSSQGPPPTIPAPELRKEAPPVSSAPVVAPAAQTQAPQAEPMRPRMGSKFGQKDYKHPIQNLLASELATLQTKLSKEDVDKVVGAIGDWWQQELDVSHPARIFIFIFHLFFPFHFSTSRSTTSSIMPWAKLTS